MNKRQLVFFGLVAPFLFTGCLSQFTSPDVPPREYPDPPDSLDGTAAKEAALDYEAAYVHNQLRNEMGVRDFEVPGGPSSQRATIVNKTSQGMYVEIQVPYYYSKGQAEVDGVSKATYLVNTSEIRRVRGTNIDT